MATKEDSGGMQMKTGKAAKMIRNNRVEVPIKNQAHFINPERTTNVFENKINAPGPFSMLPSVNLFQMSRFVEKTRVRFMPLVNKLTVPDYMLITSFSSRNIKISNQQSPAQVMPISLIDQLFEVIKLGLETPFQAIHVSIHDVETAKPRNFKIAHGDPP